MHAAAQVTAQFKGQPHGRVVSPTPISPMNPKTSSHTTARFSGLTCIVLTTLAAAIAASPPTSFWKQPPADLARLKFAPANVELVAAPDLTLPLTTVKMGGSPTERKPDFQGSGREGFIRV